MIPEHLSPNIAVTEVNNHSQVSQQSDVHGEPTPPTPFDDLSASEEVQGCPTSPIIVNSEMGSFITINVSSGMSERSGK